MAETKVWAGTAPAACDLCKRPLKGEFVDGRVAQVGSWGFMCRHCHAAHGMGLGTGRGQRYVYSMRGQWVKTAG